MTGRTVLKILLGGVCAGGLLWFLYGWFAYPDAPLHPCGQDRFCGKQGQPHTSADYEAFLRWQTSLFVTHPLALLAGLLLKRMGKRPG